MTFSDASNVELENLNVKAGRLIFDTRKVDQLAQVRAQQVAVGEELKDLRSRLQKIYGRVNMMVGSYMLTTLQTMLSCCWKSSRLGLGWFSMLFSCHWEKLLRCCFPIEILLLFWKWNQRMPCSQIKDIGFYSVGLLTMLSSSMRKMKTMTTMVICFIADSPMVLLISSDFSTSHWFHLDWMCFPACSWTLLPHWSQLASTGISWVGGFHSRSCHTGNDSFIKHKVSVQIPKLCFDWSLLVHQQPRYCPLLHFRWDPFHLLCVEKEKSGIHILWINSSAARSRCYCFWLPTPSNYKPSSWMGMFTCSFISWSNSITSCSPHKLTCIS